jgi:hypothetical protein
MSDIVKQLRDKRYPGQMEMRLKAAEIIEQYRIDQKSDEQINNELRAEIADLRAKIEELDKRDYIISARRNSFM